MVAKFWQCQSSMNRGELDPRLVGRIDLQSYYNGVFKARNVLNLVQGGLRRRPGQLYIGEALDNGRVELFAFNTEQEYLIVFTPGFIQFYKGDVLQTNINGSGFDYITNPYSLTELQELDFIQSADTAIIVHENHAPRTLTRTSDTDWTLATAPLSNIPQFDFADASSPTPTSQIQEITFNSANNADTYKLVLNGILTDEIVYNAAATAEGRSANEDSIRDALLALPNTPRSGITAVYKSGTTYTVTFSDGAANDWNVITGSPVKTQDLAFDVSGTITQAGVSREEDVWSATRGWPRTCTFHEARLYFGGSLSRPQTLWGSIVNNFFDFDVAKARDDEAINVTLDSDQLNAITGVFSNRNLQIFTTGQEFYIPASPITPSNISVPPQTNFGSKRVRPITIDGLTLYVQRTGKAIRRFTFVDGNKAYESNSVSILASHLVVDPVKMAASRGTESVDANYAYILGSDGNIAVFNSLLSEEITSFTNWETSGNVKSITVLGDRLYMLVERVIDGNTVYYIEKESDTVYTDSAKIATVSSDTLTGLSHLEGETVKVRADGSVMADQVVSGGQITIERTATTIEAGLSFTPTIKTMPLNIALQNGPNAALQKKLVRVALEIYESLGVIVNGERIADKTFGVDVFDVPEPQTGLEEVRLLGWDREAQVTITQEEPVPMTILSICAEVGI